ncbi:MAG: ABC transporter substrate-binding protein [Thermomicrobiales bacterium]
MHRRTLLIAAANASIGALLAACGSSSATATPNATAANSISPPALPRATTSAASTTGAPSVASGTPLTSAKLAISYIPNVQFANFYVADAKGRFAAEGLKVEYDYGTTTDYMTLLARGERDFLNASGDEVALARAQGLPVVYIAAVYQQYPIAIFAPKGKGLTDAQALTKMKVGLPGKFGSTYIGYKAILYANKIDESKVNAVEIGFTQAQSVQQGKVDAAVGFTNNDLVQLKAQGVDVDALRVSDVYNLPAPGIATSEKMLADHPDTVRAFLRAVIAGMRDTQADPRGAFAEVLKSVPEAANSATVQQQVLAATIELCGDPAKYGTIDPAAWTRMTTFMKETALVKGDPKPEEMYTTKFLP